MPIIHTRPYAIRYRAPICSEAGGVALAAILFSIIVPFLLGYSSGVNSFYPRSSSYLEQPTVAFEHSFLFLLDGTKSAVSNSIGVTTEPITLGYADNAGWILANLNPAIPQSGVEVRVPMVKSVEIDIDRDGKVDYLELNMQLPLKDDEAINRVRLMVPLKFNLNKYIQFTMESLAIFDAASVQSISGAQVTADLRLVQNQLLKNSAVFRYAWDVPILNFTDGWYDGDVREWQWEEVIRGYQHRTIRTDISSPAPSLTYPRARSQPFTFRLRLNYPSQIIYYQPSFMEIIKTAWIQYFAIAYAVGTLTWYCIQFIVRHHVVRTEMLVDRIPVQSGVGGQFKPALF